MSLQEKIDVAISRIQTAREMSLKYMNDELYVMISGGKDSSVIQELALMSGGAPHFVHSLTTVDAPETVYFIRKEMDRLRALGYDAQIRRPPKTMWQLIYDARGLPPLRTQRYCCRALKERKIVTEEGKAAFIVTGVRWAESRQRSGRGEFEAIAAKTANKIVLNNDNDPARKLFETCRLRSERVVNPIIDWEDSDVWEFIHTRHLPYNPLYDEGWTRIGCVGCPMTNPKERKRRFEQYPKIRKAWVDAFQRGLDRGIAEGRNYTWRSGEEVLAFMDSH